VLLAEDQDAVQELVAQGFVALLRRRSPAILSFESAKPVSAPGKDA
jgi:hypothetical protein